MNDNKSDHNGQISLTKLTVIAFATLAIGYCINLFIFSIYMVPSASMEPTLVEGDHYLVNKIAYSDYFPSFDRSVKLEKINRGDIIVFRNPEDLETDYVKRVIAIGGDKLEVQNRSITINGRKIQSPSSSTDSFSSTIREKFGNQEYDVFYLDYTKKPEPKFEVVVPENSVFVLGDNRDHSIDSRHFGKVPLDYIIGKGVVILWSAPPERKGFFSLFNIERVLKKI